MSSSFLGLQIAKTGLSAYQASINTTAHNITNASTDGYSRQVVIKQASDALRTNNSYGMQGTGVDIIGIERKRSSYYDMKYWSNTSYYGQYVVKSDYMQQIENYFNEIETDGFNTEFNNFFNTLVDMTTEPDSSDKRVTAISYAESLSEYFNSLSNNLTQIQESANDQIKSVCDRINSISDQILSINKQIQTIEINGDKANDLRDQRDLLIDELSGYVNIEVKETPVYVTGATDSKGQPLESGITSCAIYINGYLLVDELNANHLICSPRQEKVNESDREGLYEVTWNTSDGPKFELNSTGLDGQLKGLFDIRDGNNQENFKGTASVNVGDDGVVVEAATITDINKLNIPDKGIITVDGLEYEYSDFLMNFDENGKIKSYTFILEEPIKRSSSNGLVRIGDTIDYKGIPYYQAQLNEFVRTFAQDFNRLHNQGVDDNGNSGVDFFTAANAVTGKDMVLAEEESLAGSVLSAKEESYYRLNAKNLIRNSALNQSTFCTRYPDEQGVASCELLKDLVDLKEDDTMFSQGSPAEFLQAITADISVDTSKAKNFESCLTDIISIINNQRISVSGVDTNEELANLAMYQKGYNLSSKMMSVFNEVYDKLINETGL